MTTNEQPTAANRRVLDYDPFEPMPKAWMGFRVDRVQGGFMVAVCGWCSDKAKADALAQRYDLRITHAICEECFAKQTAQLTGSP